MKPYPLKMITCISALLICMELQAQNDSIVVRKVQQKTAVEFRGKNGKPLKTLNAEDLNPYRTGFQPRGAANGRQNPNPKLRFDSYVSNASRSAVAMSHSVKVFAGEGNEQLQDQGESTLSIYDKAGAEIFRQKIDADNAGMPLMSPNGKYAAVSFWGPVEDDVTRKVGFSIYDVQTRTQVCDVPTNDLAYAWVAGDAFVFDVPESGATRPRTYYVFDTRTGTLYKKTYDLAAYANIKRFESNGVVFHLPPDSERIEEYKTHFTRISR